MARSDRTSDGTVPLGRAADIYVPAVVLAAITFLCWIWPLLGDLPAPVGGSVLRANAPLLSEDHFLGTDMNGNDVWSRLLHGGRTSMLIAVLVNVAGFLTGGIAGAIAGYFGGIVDAVTMRIVDILIAFPSLVIAIVIAQGLGPGLGNTVLALTFYSAPAFARVARAAALQVRGRDFVLAARLSGRGHVAILVRHVLGNIVLQLVTFAVIGMGIVIVVEGALSFLGLGVQSPEPSWGNMIFHGQEALLVAPHLVLIPSLFLVVTVLSLNMLSEALRVRWS